MQKKFIYFGLIAFSLIAMQSFAQKISGDHASIVLKKSTGKPMATLVNINNISMWAKADGILGKNPDPNNAWGVFYPSGTAGVVYTDGLLWGGYVKDGKKPELRVGGQYFNAGTVSGCIISKGIAEEPADPDVRIWRIRPDWQTADLTQDAAEFFNVAEDSVTQHQIEAIQAQYETDWNEWPWRKGAPFYDTNGNGIMDEGEEPGLAYADQVVWFVVNDLDSMICKKLGSEDFEGSPPIGLEMQVTLWAYNRTGSRLSDAFQNIIFKHVRLIYKGRKDTPDNARIDSMFVAQFAFTDLGDYHDNLLGCDTTLQLGYCYNGYDIDREFYKFNLPPPAIGYTLIQGPLVSSDNPLSQAYFDFGTRNGFVNLNMSSFWPKYTGTPWTDPMNTLQMYNAMNGFLPFEDKLLPFEDLNGNPTNFPFSGDPVTGTGHVDGLGINVFSVAPGVRRFMMNSGSFTMALGDTQEVIIALVGGIGSDRLASVSVMKYYVKWAQCWAQTVFRTGFGNISSRESSKGGGVPEDFRLHQNHPNPFNTSTNIRYDLPMQKKVTLAIYNLLGQVVKVLADENQNPGYYLVSWDGTDDRGNKVPTGIYLYKIEAGHWVLTKKLMLLK